MARDEHQAWLHGEIDRWEALGLVTAGQAAALRARYPPSSPSVSWGLVVFASLGAAVTGLGTMLLLAYNWHAIPKCGKLGIVFGQLIAIHAAGLYLVFRVPRWRALGEALGLLGTMLFGAGIFLVAQVYHLDEHFPNAFLLWGTGALVLAWAMPSVAQGVLAALLLAIWAGCERVGFHAVMPVAPLVVGGLLGGLAVRLHSRVLSAVVVPAFLVAYGFMLPDGGDDWRMLVSALLAWSAALVAVASLVRRGGVFPGMAPILSGYGWTAFLVLLFILAFPSLAAHCLRYERTAWDAAHWLFWALPLAAAAGAWVAAAVAFRRPPAGGAAAEDGFELLLVPLVVALAMADAFRLWRFGGWAVAGPFNLVFLSLAVARMARGCRKGRLGPTAVGSLLLVALVIARYFDLFESLLVRGAVFVALGAALLVQGVWVARTRRRARAGGRAP